MKRTIINTKGHAALLALLWLIAGMTLLIHNHQLNAQIEWTLDDVIQKAEGSSIYRYQADADNQIAQAQWAFFKTNFNPRVSLDLLAPNYIKTSREIIQPDGSIAFQSVSQNNSSLQLGIQQNIAATGGSVFLSTALQRFDNFSLDRKQYNGVPFRVGINQPLFGFNQLKWSKEIEPLILKEADKAYIINMEDIHLQATLMYFNLLEADVNLSIATTNGEVNQQLLDIAKERYALGKISRNDLLQLELEYRGANKDISGAQFQVEFAEGALHTFLGDQQREKITLRTPAPLLSQIEINAAKALAQARANRPEIVSFERQKLEANREIKRAKTDYGIQANVFASYGLARGAQTVGEIYRDPNSEQQLSLSLSVPILDWGRKKSAVAIAQAQKDLIVQQIAQDELNFENEIIQAIANWHQLQNEVKLQEEIKEVSQERFNISKERYVLGDISITDLTLAQREKDQAQRDYIQSLRNYWVTYYQIRKLTAYDWATDTPITYYLKEKK